MTVACFADFGTLLSRERFALFHPDASLECRGFFMPHAHHTPTARAQTPGEGSGVHEDDTKHPPEGYPPVWHVSTRLRAAQRIHLDG